MSKETLLYQRSAVDGIGHLYRHRTLLNTVQYCINIWLSEEIRMSFMGHIE